MTLSNSRNIFIIGDACTGKTTIISGLQRYFDNEHPQPAVIREVARNTIETLGYGREDIVNVPDRCLAIQYAILRAQYEAEMTLAEGSSTWYITDRSGIDPIVYTKFFVGDQEANAMLESDAWKRLAQNMRAGTVMLCEAGCPWLVDDGTRLMHTSRDEWLRCDSMFRELLAASGIDFVVVPRDLTNIADRVALVVEAHKHSRT